MRKHAVRARRGNRFLGSNMVLRLNVMQEHKYTHMLVAYSFSAGSCKTLRFEGVRLKLCVGCSELCTGTFSIRPSKRFMPRIFTCIGRLSRKILPLWYSAYLLPDQGQRILDPVRVKPVKNTAFDNKQLVAKFDKRRSEKVQQVHKQWRKSDYGSYTNTTYN